MYYYTHIFKTDYSDPNIYNDVVMLCEQLKKNNGISLSDIREDTSNSLVVHYFFENKKSKTTLRLTTDHSIECSYIKLISPEQSTFDSIQNLIINQLDIYNEQEILTTSLEDILDYPGLLLKIAIGTGFLTPFPKPTFTLIKDALFYNNLNISSIAIATIYNTLRQEFIPLLEERLHMALNNAENNLAHNIEIVQNELKKSNRAEELKKIKIRISGNNL